MKVQAGGVGSLLVVASLAVYSVVVMLRLFRKNFLFILLPMALFVFVGPPLTHAGFGVSPGAIQEGRLVPGITVTRTIYLVQGNPEADVGIVAEIESRDIKDWITLDSGFNFVIPAGVQQFPMGVTVKVPKDAELGQYSAVVRVHTQPPPAEAAGSVAISLGGLVNIDLTVGNDIILEYRVKGLRVFDVKQGEPLQVSARIENTGNVPASPDSATFELFDKFGNTRLAFITAENEQFPRVPAFAEESVVLEFPLDIVIAPGEYRSHVKVFNEKGDVLREIKIGFSVLERTFLDDIKSYVLIVGVVLIVIIVALVIFLRRRRIRNNAPIEKISETHV